MLNTGSTSRSSRVGPVLSLPLPWLKEKPNMSFQPTKFWQRIAIFSFFMVGFSYLGCRSSNRAMDSTDTKESVELVRKYVMLQPVLFGRLEYNPIDAGVVERLIDPSIRKNIRNRYFDRWPATESDAQQVAKVIAANVWSTVLDDNDGRSAVEEAIKKYWDNPKISQVSDPPGVLVDLGMVPGKIVRAAGGYFTINTSEFTDRGELSPEELVKRFATLRTQYPNLESYQVNVVTTPHLRDHPVLHYRYLPSRDILEIHHHDNIYQSPNPIGGDLSNLATGKVPVRTEELKLLPKSTRVGVR